MKKNLKIVWLWNDAMNRNGSQGNILALSRRLEWRGIGCEIVTVPVGTEPELSDCDILYLGAGLPYENAPLLSALNTTAPKIREYIGRGGVMLAVCEGLELMGRSITLPDGRILPGAAAAPLKTVYGEKRVAGNLLFEFGKTTVAAFENHAGCIELEEAAEGLGKLLAGQGNKAGDERVGIRYRNFFGAHAYSLLPCNVALCDAILLAALRREDEKAVLTDLNDSFETLAHELTVSKIRQESNHERKSTGN